MAAAGLPVEFGQIDKQNVGQLRKINQAVFPIEYGDKFYKDVTEHPEALTKYAYWNGFVVGAICTRLEPHPTSPNRRRMYIMTLGVLSAYRGRGVGKKLVKSVMDAFEEESGEGKTYEDVDEIYVHTQTNNNDAVLFYVKGFEFEKGAIVENYYKRIEPPNAVILSKKLR